MYRFHRSLCTKKLRNPAYNKPNHFYSYLSWSSHNWKQQLIRVLCYHFRDMKKLRITKAKEFFSDHKVESGEAECLHTLLTSIIELTCTFMLPQPTCKLLRKEIKLFFYKQILWHSNWSFTKKEIIAWVLNVEKMW